VYRNRDANQAEDLKPAAKMVPDIMPACTRLRLESSHSERPHAYLEFDILDATKRKELASTISAIREPRTVGFSAAQKRLSRMLDSMAGLITGPHEALTRYTQPLTGSYYFVPSVESLRRLR
jgi:Dyp-type peroxidase family